MAFLPPVSAGGPTQLTTDAMEAINERVPIWKRELFADGSE